MSPRCLTPVIQLLGGYVTDPGVHVVTDYQVYNVSHILSAIVASGAFAFPVIAQQNPS